MDRNCSLKCHCQEGGKVTCQPLCARNAHIQECDPSENRKVVNFSVLLPHADSQSNCSCPIEICEPAEGEEVVIVTM